VKASVRGRAAGAALLLLGGCERFEDTTLGPCESACSGVPGESIIVQVASERLDAPVDIELNPCLEQGYLPDGAPVVVALSGSFQAVISPLERNEKAVESKLGLVALYPSFPTDEGDFASFQAGDYRGSGARWATEAALRYAAGEIEDEEGCTLRDRIAPPLSQQPPWLHGQSNGGNLAMAVLADPELELPPISGVTTFETPAGAQFITVELGSAERPLPLYEPGSCAWTASEGMRCEVDYEQLRWDAYAWNDDGSRGVAYFDLDENEVYDEERDSPVWGIRPQFEDEFWLYYSAPMNQALVDAGIAPDALRSLEDTLDFWATRDASRLVGDALARHPELPFTVLGTETDHILGAEDHPHVTGLAHALQQSGARWVRVNPDEAYLTRIMGAPPDWEDNPANEPTYPGDPAMSMLPKAADVGQHSRDYTTAALLELMERSWCGDWSEDLDHVLLP
jgi:hypothetical protein